MTALIDFNKDENDQLLYLVRLYSRAKACIIYSEEIDPDSKVNLQIMKELRDAFDHLMRILVDKIDNSGALLKKNHNYYLQNLSKSIGHVYRSAFDALDGAVISVKVDIVNMLKPYSIDAITEVIKNYWSLKAELIEIANRVTEHRERKDVGIEDSKIFDNYINDISSLKKIHKTVTINMELIHECHNMLE